MTDTRGFTVGVSNLDHAGSAKEERNRQYSIYATCIDGGGKVWRTTFLDEEQYRRAIGILIPEKRARLLPAINAPGNWSPGRQGELLFSLAEIQSMGLIEMRDEPPLV